MIGLIINEWRTVKNWMNDEQLSKEYVPTDWSKGNLPSFSYSNKRAKKQISLFLSLWKFWNTFHK